MALFLSTFTNKVDKKGRVSVPSQFRSMLKSKDFSGIIVYESPINNCLEACDITRIERVIEALDEKDPFSAEKDAFATTFLGGSAQLGFDSEGRVLLPENLIEIAGINEQAVFVGKGSTFEIWEPSRFEEYSKQAREKAKAFRYSLKPKSQGLKG